MKTQDQKKENSQVPIKPKDIDAERHPEEQIPPNEFPSYEPKKVDDPLLGVQKSK